VGAVATQRKRLLRSFDKGRARAAQASLPQEQAPQPVGGEHVSHLVTTRLGNLKQRCCGCHVERCAAFQVGVAQSLVNGDGSAKVRRTVSTASVQQQIAFNDAVLHAKEEELPALLATEPGCADVLALAFVCYTCWTVVLLGMATQQAWAEARWSQQT
jgi:hypothetical protein